MNKKKKAFKVFDAFVNKRSALIQDKEEEDWSGYYASGNGFFPASKEKEYNKGLKTVSENLGDTGFLFPQENQKKNTKDVFTEYFKTRKRVLDEFVESEHPRASAGKSEGGQFVKKGEEGVEQKKTSSEKHKEGLAGEPEVVPETKAKPKYQLEFPKPRKPQYTPTPEKLKERREKYKLKEKRKNELDKNPVGVSGKEKESDVSTCKRRRLEAEKYWEETFGVDLSDGTTTQDGGYSPNSVVDQVTKNKEFMSLPVFRRIQLVSDMQRKNLPSVYSEKSPVDQNTKQEAALVYGGDTVRGCLNNCISCYACMLAGGVAQVRFDVPVKNNLTGKFIYTKTDIQLQKAKWEAEAKKWEHNPTASKKVRVSPNYPQGIKVFYEDAVKKRDFAQKQLDDLEKYKLDHTVLRIGVVGDPATDWVHTNKTMKQGLKHFPPESVVYVSKLQRIDGFDPKVVRNMHVSVDPFNPEHMERTMSNVLKLKKLDPSLNIVLRIRSFDSHNEDLMNNLKKAVKFANDNDLPVLETKMRFTKSVANFMEMNLDSYHTTDSINIKANRNFLSDKGWNYNTKKVEHKENKDLQANKHLECDPLLEGCQKCGNCVNTVIQNYPWNKKQR